MIFIKESRYNFNTFMKEKTKGSCICHAEKSERKGESERERSERLKHGDNKCKNH